jgi:hypothetical protein
MNWDTPYGKDAKYYTSGEWIVAWETVAEGAVPPDWMDEDGEGRYWRRLGYRKEGRWQVRRMTGPENSEALEIAPTLAAAKAIVERMAA